MLFEPITGDVGVMAQTVPPSLAELSEDDVRDLRQAFSDYGLVILRGRQVSLEEQFAVCALFGDRIDQAGTGITWKNVASTGRSEMRELSFHADYSNAPAGGLLTGASLCATELPSHPTATIFASSVRALEEMPDTLRQRIEGSTAIHCASRSDDTGTPVRHNLTNATDPRAEHPIVMSHPETGRSTLYLSDMNTERIVGLADAESIALLDEILDWQQQPQFVYRHVWQLHDLVLWDQLLIAHKREYEKNDNATGARILRRVSFTYAGYRDACQAFFDLPRVRQEHRVNAM